MTILLLLLYSVYDTRVGSLPVKLANIVIIVPYLFVLIFVHFPCPAILAPFNNIKKLFCWQNQNVTRKLFKIVIETPKRSIEYDIKIIYVSQEYVSCDPSAEMLVRKQANSIGTKCF